MKRWTPARSGPREASRALHSDAALRRFAAGHRVHGRDGHVGARQNRAREAGVGEVADLFRDSADRWRRAGATHDGADACTSLGEGSAQAGPDQAVGPGDDHDHVVTLARVQGRRKLRRAGPVDATGPTAWWTAAFTAAARGPAGAWTLKAPAGWMGEVGSASSVRQPDGVLGGCPAAADDEERVVVRVVHAPHDVGDLVVGEIVA